MSLMVDRNHCAVQQRILCCLSGSVDDKSVRFLPINSAAEIDQRARLWKHPHIERFAGILYLPGCLPGRVM